MSDRNIIGILIWMILFPSIIQISKLKFIPIFYIFVIILLLLTIVYKKKEIFLFKSKELIILTPLVLSLLLSIPSAFIHSDIHGLINYAGLLTVVILIFKLTERLYNVKHSVKNILIYSSVISLIISVVSLFLDGLYFRRYEGIFDYFNSMGMFSSTMLCFITSMILVNKTRNKKILFLTYSALIILSIFLIASNSRASLISSIVGILITILLIIFSNHDIKLIKRAFRYILIGSIIISLLYIIGAFDFFFEKLTAREEEHGQIDPRLLIWSVLIIELKFWGIGPDYVSLLNLPIGAHNTFLSQATRYGLPSAVMFYTYVITVLYFAVKFFKKGYLSISIPLIAIIIKYLIHSQFETGAGTPDIWIITILIGILIGVERNSINIFKK